jgi:type VI secretion system secreted protein Hcp
MFTLLNFGLEESMAIDVYLSIDGIKGESNDSAHIGWIEVTAAQWGVKQPRSATASTSGGHTAERCEHKSIALTKLADLSSPILMQTCSAGRTIPKAKLEFMRADGDGRPVKYYEIELENVLIGSIDQVVHQGSGLHDSFTLKFSTVRWRYTQQKISGGAAGNTVGGWDLASNRIV